MIVHIPSPLRSYTNGASKVASEGGTIAAILLDLDGQFRGLRFRIVDEQNQLRRHMRLFVNDEMTRDLNTALCPDDELTIMQALSGGI